MATATSSSTLQALMQENDQLKQRIQELEALVAALRKELDEQKAERALYGRLRGETSFEEMTRWEEEFRNFKPEDSVSITEFLASLEAENRIEGA